MKNLRDPIALALTALALCMGASAQAQTTVAATVGTMNPTTGTTAGVTVVTGSATGPGTGVTAPTTQRVPKGFVTDLAKASLAKQGITNPTKAQLAAESKAIAAQRAQGKGWGVIAQSLGLNLGQVVSAANQARRDARKDQDKRGDDKDGKGKHGKNQGGGASTGHSGSHGSGGGGGKGK